MGDGTPIRVGDLLADGGTVEGFLLEQVLDEMDPNYDDTIDYTQDFAWSRNGHRYDKWPMQALPGDGSWESRGADPLAGVAANHELSAAWRAVFSVALDWPIHPWSGMVRPLAEVIADDGWHVLAYGGFVRDLLLGADPRKPGAINDLDICGTVPAARFREYCFEFQVAHAGGLGWRRNAFWHMETSLNQVVHIRRMRRIDRQPTLDARPSLQYAALKRWERKNPSTKANEWVFGSSYAEDARWRDIQFNTLMYDPVAGTIVDPTGYGLADLGLTPADLLADPPLERSAPHRVEPLALPENAGSDFVANALVRVFKQVVDWHATTADFRPVEAWAQTHRGQLEDRLQDPAIGLLVRERLKQLRDYSVGCGRVLPRVESRERCLGPTLSELLGHDLLASGVRAEHGGSRPPTLVGNGIAQFDPGTGALDLGKAYASQDGTTSGAQRQFASLIQGYRHDMAEVRLGGSADDPDAQGLTLTSLILIPPADRPDLPTYVELSGGRPVVITEFDLAGVQRRDVVSNR